MTDDKPARQGTAKQRSAKRKRSGGERLPASALAKRARDQLGAITGLRCEGVTAIERGDDGNCTVSVELLEFARIPPTNDLLGSYAVELDARGELRAYTRVRRYARCQTHEPVQPTVEDQPNPPAP